jgi:hypothetical protein
MWEGSPVRKNVLIGLPDVYVLNWTLEDAGEP